MNIPTMSLDVIPNLVDVVVIAVIPCGKTYDCSIAVTFMLSFEYDVISELQEPKLINRT
jgi:hypothetical protein